jgi:tetratricopeptide (TPR) repeat protein
MHNVFRRLETLPPSGTLWLIGDGGSGKTTILQRVAFECAQAGQNVFTLNLEAHLTRGDVESVLSLIRYSSMPEQALLCIDNPADDEETLETILREIPDYSSNVHIVFAERAHRYHALRRMGCLTYLHGEEDLQSIVVRNPRRQRQEVYNKLFDLLDVSTADRESLREFVLNEHLVYVYATYSILLELKRKRKIDFDFDWDDYRKTAADVPAFREGYKYIALFYLFGVRTPFSGFSRICGADDAQQRLFLEKFRGLINEPIVVDERRDDSFRQNTHLRTKHEIISEIFFREHPEINKDELLMEWAEHTDFAEPLEAQALINIFGAKKNYETEIPLIDFRRLMDFLLNGYLKEKVALSTKLNATLHLARFWLLRLQGNTEEAVAALKSFLAGSPENLHGRTELAKVYQQLDRFEEAEAVLWDLLEIDKDNIHALTELARIYRRQNRLVDAEAVLLTVLDKRRRDVNARTELAKIYQRQGKLEKAEALLMYLLQLKPDDLQARTELAKIYQRQGKLKEAEAVLMKLVELDPNNLQARTELAKIYQRQGKLEEAEVLLLQSLEIDDKQLHPRTELAKIYQRQGKLKEAEAVLMDLLQLEPDDLQARTELAKIYQRQGKLDLAIQRLEEYIALDPRGLHPRTELAKIYQRQGKLKEAEVLLLQSLEIDDKQLHPRTELAKIYQRQGKLDLAIKRLEEYIAFDPRGLHPRTELAKIYQRQGKLEEAVRLLEEEIKLAPNALHPRTELAKIYQRQGKFDLAASRAEETLAIDPLNDHAMSELLAIWSRLGKKEECVRRFLQFIAQPNYRFSQYSQAPTFRFFQCCRNFNLKAEAKLIFERFQSQLDDQNIKYYRSNF